MKFDIDDAGAIIDQLILQKDWETLMLVQRELEYNEAKLRVMLYELDEKLQAIKERGDFSEEGVNYDS